MAETAVNYSKAGFAFEKTFMENLALSKEITQPFYKPLKEGEKADKTNRSKAFMINYKPSKFYTNPKIYVGGKCMAENDGCVILEAESEFLANFTDNIYDVDLYEI
ncbi:MAG: hypothetical protein PHN56_04185, partial [Candidatus Nanoarchaeia archaeon]|nr:hypothetical protein [Candidatus Nanoarchaeia archaeon]